MKPWEMMRQFGPPASGGGNLAASILAKTKAWWTFDSTMSDVVAGLALSPAGAYTAGKKGNAVETVKAQTGATGISGYEASGFTLCGWVRLTATNSRVLLTFANNVSGGEVISFDNVSGAIGANYRNSNGPSILPRMAAANNVWHFVEVSWLPGAGTTGQVRISLNNGTPHLATKSKGTEVAHQFFSLGSIYSKTVSGCDLDETMFAQGPLTADEIAYLYNGGVGRSYAEVQADA